MIGPAVAPPQDGWPMGIKKPAAGLAASTLTAGSLLTVQGRLEEPFPF